MVSKIAALYEEGDPGAQMLMYTYLDTELSFSPQYLENGNSFVARMTAHREYPDKDAGYLSEMSNCIYSTNDGKNTYKPDVADGLEDIGYKRREFRFEVHQQFLIDCMALRRCFVIE